MTVIIIGFKKLGYRNMNIIIIAKKINDMRWYHTNAHGLQNCGVKLIFNRDFIYIKSNFNILIILNLMYMKSH